MRRAALLALALSALLPAALRAGEPTPAQLDHFEKKVRPLLVNTCYECHSVEKGKSKGGLTLDTRDGLLKGGTSGPAVVPGDAEKSLLFKAVRGDDPDAVMPPKGSRLSADQIADLQTWIATGVADPRTGTAASTPQAALFEKAKTHWAFQPVKEPAVPAVRAAAARNPIDAFLLAKLEPAGLGFAPLAEKRTLIRRATIDLHGLPPTPEDVAAFLADNSPDAFEKLVERLLASPRYGERWGRHWLDVARYADTMGAIFGGEDQYAYAYSYRDYVIQSFNTDKPVDRFLFEQLAADTLISPEDNRALAAMGFLTLGRRKDRNVDDEVHDDRIDVISRGLLGLTVSCARCHDHKLEPITAKDYYGLYAVLRSSTEPANPPELKPTPETPETTTFRAERTKLRKAFIETTATEAERAVDLVREQVGAYLLAAVDGKGQKTSQNNALVASLLKPRGLHDHLYNLTLDRQKKWFEKYPAIFGLWSELAGLKDEERDGKLAAVIAKHRDDPKTNALLVELIKDVKPESMNDVAAVYTALFREAHLAGGMAGAKDLAAARGEDPADGDRTIADLEKAVYVRVAKTLTGQPLGDPDLNAVREAMNAAETPTFLTAERFRDDRLVSEAGTKLIDAAAKPWKELEAKHPGAPARSMAMKDGTIYEGKVFLRGNANTPGEPAPRQFIQVLDGPERKPFPKDKSGRKELAEAIVAPANPLTARVFVNRVWAWHFGEGIVRTPSDFGLRGEAPTHPELLDYLAAQFVKEGWSLKKLHRLMMRSNAYQQKSTVPAAVVKADPENKLWARMNGRLLEFEAFRDAQLAVAGRLNLQEGGRSVDITRTDKDALRRAVYGLVDRKSLPNLFRSFDFPDPNFSAARRSRTALTPAALFLMNSPFVVDNARALAVKVSEKKPAAPADGVRMLYQWVFQREPSENELRRAVAFLDGYPARDIVRPEATDWQYGRGSYDLASKSVKNFAPLTQYTGKSWQMPDKALGNLALRADGGEPGKGADADVIRRWTAPQDGKLKIVGELTHAEKSGDGIIARVVRNATESLGEWSAKTTGVSTALENVAVKKGETLDFIVSGGKDPNSDRFQWSPTLTMVTAEMPGMPGMPRIWDAKTDFMDIRQMPKPLNPWEELAQVLLLSNEFIYAE